jgi:hypothetical protein
MWVDGRRSEVLGVPECRRLLALGASEHRPGHVGFTTEPGRREGLGGNAPTVLPVDYAVWGPDVVIRVGEGLFRHIAGRLVAFQVDGVEDGRGWSVLVRGPAQPVELADVPRVPVPRVARPGAHLVRIRSDVVTGRRLGTGSSDGTPAEP